MTYGGDFGDRPTDGDFSGNGIAYGGKRKPSPKMQEVKYNYQNIEVVFENDSEFTVINKNLFTNTDEFDALVILQADGTVVHKSAISISVPALSREKFKVPAGIKNAMIDPEKEYSILVSFVLKENRIWADAGHEVAFGQYVMKKLCPHC